MNDKKFILYYFKTGELKFVDHKDVLDELYELRYRLINELDIKNYNGTNKEIKKRLLEDNFIEKQKDELSRIDTKIPLYDTYSKNMFLITREMVFARVSHYHYRFPDKKLFEEFKEMKKNYKGNSLSILDERKRRKLRYMIDFLKNFNLDILERTYMTAFYKYSNEIGKNYTLCKKPSFLPHFHHILPYYTRSEIINLGLNMELIKSDDTYYNEQKISELCNIVKGNDINSKTLLEHQTYIVESNKIGIVQYYTLMGSYFMNQYLRGLTRYSYKNEYLEELIIAMNNVIRNAPAFDKEYILYRFIENDSYLKHINIGDIYTEKSFISTTRDAFYNSDKFKFGFILIKIKIPKGITGIGLCIETASHFPKEVEIILAPMSKLRLDKKDDNCKYYHTDNNFATKVKSRYEFTYVGKEELKMNREISTYNQPRVINFLDLEKEKYVSIDEKIKMFVRKNTSLLYSIKCKIGNEMHDIILEWYNSTDAYKKYYALEVQNGFSMYSIKDNRFTFMIELGEHMGKNYMYVNYYMRHSISDYKKTISDNDFIKFISSVGYYFNVPIIVIYTDYSTCDSAENQVRKNSNIKYYGGNYCTTFYDYLKYGKKKYSSIDSVILKPKFKYYYLDLLKKTNPNKILNKKDRDEIYQIYKTAYKPYVTDDALNLSDFYIWIVENYCYLTSALIEKMPKLFHKNNPFEQDYYFLDPNGYLYANNLINTYYNADDVIMDDVYAPKNDYRLNYQYLPMLPSRRAMD